MKRKNTAAVIICLLILVLNTAGCAHKQQNPVPVKNAPGNESVEPPAQNPVASNVQQPGTDQASNAQVPGKTYSWYLLLNKEHNTPGIDPPIKDLLAGYEAFYVVPGSSKQVYLTFDEGYEIGNTGQILDILKASGVKAAFFITGQYIKTQPELVKRMKAEGHLVCNHSWNHPDITTLNKSNLNQEITTLADEYQRLTGSVIDKYFRPPMGNYSPASLQTINELGYTVVFWSVAFNDWDPQKQPGADYSYRYVMENIHPGAVILLHGVSKSDTDALERIIESLREQGYTLAQFQEAG